MTDGLGCVLIRWAVTTLRRGAWAPVLVFSIHVIGAAVFHVYRRIPDFDVPMHFFGGVAIAYFFGAAYRAGLESKLLGEPSRVVFPLVVIGWTCLAAVIWEFSEFISDATWKTHTQPSLDDTMLDLLMGLLGGGAYLLCSMCRQKSQIADAHGS